MNDLQLWPKNYPKNYDPKILEVGDLLQYNTHDSGGIIYEVIDFNVPTPADEFGLNIQEVCKPRDGLTTENNRSFSFQETSNTFCRVFSLRIKNKDKILKSNLCKVIAAKFFIEKELNDLLIEMEI